MEWHELLFMHWRVAPAQLQPLLPPGLLLDTYDGSAWIAIVPFRMAGVRLRGLPPLPGLAAFPELNVRTYVRIGDRPGVWFFSLDAANRVAVEAARLAFHLNYIYARMACDTASDTVLYRSRRVGTRAGAFRAHYRPTGAVTWADTGSLEHWLTERYCLYAADRRGVIRRGEIHHAPWPLQPAEALIEINSMTAPLGLTLQGAPLLHYAQRLDVVAWLPERVDAKI
ncbi:MAG TPA: DUF2071 domain-containing protein [Roseiflexaceae bacterium]|nr:DUF2071 domain-containing protein [Roseiflexaceae bacterium]HMP40465.1 DUF2071 domain-containing protein [Roseiflexaceae bacterium]